MREHIAYLLLGVLMTVSGLYAMITGNAGEKDYGDVVVVGMSGWWVHLLGVPVAVFGGYVVRTEFKALVALIRKRFSRVDRDSDP